MGIPLEAIIYQQSLDEWGWDDDDEGEEWC